MDSGETQYSSPFLSEAKSAAADDGDDTRIAFWGEITKPGNGVVRPEVVEFLPPLEKPVQARDAFTIFPKARIIPNRVFMSTTGAQYDRWKQATSKELHCYSTPFPRLLGKNLHQNFVHATLQPRRRL